MALSPSMMYHKQVQSFISIHEKITLQIAKISRKAFCQAETCSTKQPAGRATGAELLEKGLQPQGKHLWKLYENPDQEKGQQWTSVGFFWAKHKRSQSLLYEEGFLEFMGFIDRDEETLTMPLAGT